MLLPRYIKNMGLLKGLNNWIRVEFLKSSKVKPPQLNRPVLIRWPGSDHKVFREVFLFEEYNARMESPGVILDLGANVGYTSLYFAARYPYAKILALEPDPSNFTQLKKNISGYKNIYPVHGAAWNEPVNMEIKEEGASEWERTVIESDSGEIKAYTIPMLMTEIGEEHVDLIKIDIEGAEKALFSSNTEWLDKTDIIIIELHDRMIEGCSSTFFTALSDYNYKMEPWKGSIIVKLA